MARSTLEPGLLHLALVEIVSVLVAASDLDRAERVARSITDDHAWCRALLAVATAVSTAGNHKRGQELAREVEGRVGETPRDLWVWMGVWSDLITTTADGDISLAGELASAGKTFANRLPTARSRASALLDLVPAICRVAGRDDAMYSVGDPQIGYSVVPSPGLSAGFTTTKAWSQHRRGAVTGAMLLSPG